MPLKITIQVEGQTSQPATFKGFVEALQAALSKAQLTSPYCKSAAPRNSKLYLLTTAPHSKIP